MRRKLRIQSACTVEVRRQELRVQFPLREDPETESGQRLSTVKDYRSLLVCGEKVSMQHDIMESESLPKMIFSPIYNIFSTKERPNVLHA